MRHGSWHEGISVNENSGMSYVLVTLISSSGSTPRNPGCKMVVNEDRVFDTVGGGRFEYLLIQHARELLLSERKIKHNNQSEKIFTKQFVETFPLAAQAQQCCGGSVSVLFEIFDPCAWQIAIYGAGHVAQHLVSIMKELPCRIIWVDNREGFLPQQQNAQVIPIYSTNPVNTISQLKKDTDILILTHDHMLDYDLVEAALNSVESNFVGMIGSGTKSARFRQRLTRQGMNSDTINRLCCPVGLESVTGKHPMEVAVSISAQLISIHNKNTTVQQRKGIDWRSLKTRSE